MQPQPLDPQVVALSKSIIHVESGGDFNAQGKSGESGAAQWMPNTWKAQAKDVLGDENAQMTPANQKAVLYSQIKKDKDSGLNPAQIAAKWNSGSAHGWESKVGTNAEGVAYDVPAYVKKVTSQYQALKGQSGTSSDPQPDSNGYVTTPALTGTPTGSDSSEVPTESLADDLKGRLSDASTALSGAATGKINPLSGILQTVGAGAGAVGDTVNAGLKLIPGVSAAEGLLGKGVSKLAGTSAGQSVIGGINNFSAAHPELSGDLGAVGNIAGVVGLAEGGGEIKDALGGVLDKALGKDALASTIEDVSPEIKAGTKAGAKNVAKSGTTKSLITGEINRVTDPAIRGVAETVEEAVPNFGKLKTFSDKVNAVKEAIGTYAQKLRNGLRTGDVQPILTSEDLDGLKASIDKEVSENSLLTGNEGEAAQKIFNKFRSFLPQDRDVLMEDVLDARQKLDQWVEAQRGAGVFDPAKENAVSVGLRAVRQGANDLLEEKAPNAEVKALLQKQSQLYRAAENMSGRADREIGTTRLSRFAGKHPKITGLVKNATKYGAEGIAGAAGYKVYKGFTGDN